MPVRARVHTPDELGTALREFSKRAKLTQRELAAELGVGQRHVWELEHGKPGMLTDRLFGVFRVLSNPDDARAGRSVRVREDRVSMSGPTEP
jgi:transcriptional regulator with XRE-family HTH domain